jgi:hypothetical protein
MGQRARACARVSTLPGDAYPEDGSRDCTSRFPIVQDLSGGRASEAGPWSRNMSKPRLPHVDLSQAADQLASAGKRLAHVARPAAGKAMAAAKVALRTGGRVRRVVGEGAGDLGEIVAGKTGRKVARYAAMYILSALAWGALPAGAEEVVPDDQPPPEA